MIFWSGWKVVVFFQDFVNVVRFCSFVIMQLVLNS